MPDKARFTRSPCVLFATNIIPMILVALLVFGFSLFWLIPTIREIMIENQKQRTRDLVDTVYSVALDLYQKSQEGGLSDVVARELFLRQVESLRYGPEMKDYYWVIQLDRGIIAHPYKDSIEFSQFVDKNGISVVEGMNRIAHQQGEGFIEYHWQLKDDTTRHEEKISYVKLFAPWGYIIGSGFYKPEAYHSIDTILFRYLPWYFTALAILISLILFSIIKNLRLIRDLSQGNERFLNMADNISYGLAIFQGEELIYSNRRLSEILQVDPGRDKASKESQNRAIFRLFSTSSQYEEIKTRQEYDSTKASGFWFNVSKDTPRFLKIRQTRNPNKDEYYMLVRDATDEQSREEENHRLTTIMHAAPVAIVITDPYGIVQYMNKHVELSSGYSKEELLNKNINQLKSNRVPKQTYSEMWDTITQKKTWRGELLNKRKDNSYYTEYIVVEPILDKLGQIKNYFAVKIDITDRKELETELRKAKSQAEEYEHMKSAFISNVSHEIRTPLNAICGFAELLNDRFSQEPDFLEFKEDMDNAIHTLTTLVDDLLHFSDLESETVLADYDFFNIDDLLTEALQEQLDAPTHKHSKLVEFKIQSDKNLKNRVILTDHGKFKLIIKELIENASKYTDQGEIRIAYKYQDNELCFSVSDTGKGISEQDKPHVFTTFFHGQEHFMTQHKGTGLGLNLVEKTVKVMGGSVWFESEQGKGSTFFVSGIARVI